MDGYMSQPGRYLEAESKVLKRHCTIYYCTVRMSSSAHFYQGILKQKGKTDEGAHAQECDTPVLCCVCVRAAIVLCV